MATLQTAKYTRLIAQIVQRANSLGGVAYITKAKRVILRTPITASKTHFRVGFESLPSNTKLQHYLSTSLPTFTLC